MIEAPDHFQNLQIPESHLAACKAYGMATAGNAAGNTEQPLNLTGANTVVPTDVHG